MGKGVCGFESSVCSARPACPVKFVNTKSGAHFTGVASENCTGVGPEDRTWVPPW